MKYTITIFLLIISLIVPAQQREIWETVTNDFVPNSLTVMGSNRIGVQTLFCGEYRDSLVRYFDKIEEYSPQTGDTAVFHYYRAIFGSDSLCYKERKDVVISFYRAQKTLEVESGKPPYQRFSTVVDGLLESEIAALKDSMQRMTTADVLMNNQQTCIFYALNCLFDFNGIDPAPVITRNTNFTDGHQLNAFFNHILSLRDHFPCKYRILRKVEFPDNCVLIFQNARQEFIHAVFYRKDTDEYHSKNDFHPPVVLGNMRPIVERYGRYEAKNKGLSKGELLKLADTVLIYCLK